MKATTKKGWSFCIISSEDSKQYLKAVIESIENELKDSNTNYEILIIGISDEFPEKKHIKTYNFQERIFKPRLRNVKKFSKTGNINDLFYCSGAICHKKNYLAKVSTYDKLCVMHDYVKLCKGWLNGYKEFNKNWEVCMNIILNQDGSRFIDWALWDNKLIPPNNGYRATLLPYHIRLDGMYISGTYFVVKKDFFLKHPLNEELFWGEGEDIEWSKRIRKVTEFKMNTNSKVKFLKLKSKKNPPYTDEWKENYKILLKKLNLT